MKKSVTQFDLSAAFKALDEMEYPQVEGGILPNRVDLKESFGNRKLRTDILIEDYYDISDNKDLEAAAEERENEIAKAKLARIEKIVDLDADSEDELLTSYEGKVIIQCPQCMTLFYKDEEDIEADEENPDVVNINETCQHCGNTSGYMVIGKVAPVEKTELDGFDTSDFEEEPVEEVEEEEVVEEEADKDEDLDALNLDFDEEEATEEETNESLNKAEIQKEVDKKHCSENDSENITLNEDLTEDKGEAAAQDELQAEHESPIEEAKKVCEKCGKEICECDKQELKESEVEDIIKSVVNSWDLGEACEGKECEKPLEECGGKDCSIEDAIKDILIKESLNKAEVQKDVDKKHCAENDSENLTLNEEATEEGYKGTPAERTTHLEYTDDNPADGKAVLPDNIEKQLTEDADEEEVAAEDEVIADDVVADVEAEEAPEEEAKDEEEKEELPEVDFTTSEVKEVAEEVAEEIVKELEPEIAEEEQVEEIVEEKVEDTLEAAVEEKLEAEEVEETTEEDEENIEINTEENIETEIEVEESAEETVEEGLDSEKELEGFVPVEESLNEDKDEISDAEFNKLVNSADFEKMLTDPNALEECNVNKVFEDIDEADEKAFEECITEALCETYENVKSFTLNECALKDNKFIVEGTINFNSGKTRKTQYVFESAAKTEDKAILEGYNKALSEDGSFRVNCLLKEACLVPQSMSYNYKIENNLVEGLATRK